MNRWLFGAGIALILAALAWPWLSRIPLGRLPGDVHVHRDGWDFYLPLGSSLAISILLSLVFGLVQWWLRR
jgi:prepilin signal peptidase PulO-like enzyme (type II secretory pathway)